MDMGMANPQGSRVWVAYRSRVKSGQTSLDGSAIGAPSLGIRESYITWGSARIRKL